jgi:hypothetical protein
MDRAHFCKALKHELNELDLFAFCELEVGSEGQRTNPLLEVLSQGMDDMVEYIFDKDFINVRSVLKRNNFYEIDNDIAQMNVSYFEPHFNNL